jgi:hypothetical protein
MFKKALLHSLLVVTGLLLGTISGFAGVYFHAQWSWNQQSTAEAARVRASYPTLSRFGWMEGYAMRDGNLSPDYRETLVAFTSELEDLRQQAPSAELQQAASMNLGFIYLRLASLDRKNGRSQEGAAFMSKAQSEFKSIGWKDVSESTMNTVLDRRMKHWECCGKKESYL